MALKLVNSSVALLCLVAVSWAIPSVADFDLMSAVGVWHMDEGEGDVTNDSSPSGNHAELWKNPLWVDGRFGKALQFDGQNFAWVRKAVDIPMETSPRTVMCHFKWAEINDFPDPQFQLTDAETMLSAGVRVSRGRVSLVIASAGGLGVDSHPSIRMFDWDGDTEWHHLAAVFPEGATKCDEFVVYFDGLLQEGTRMATNTVENDMELASRGDQVTIGTLCASFGNFFNGTVDDAAVFPFAMAEEDIMSVAKKGLVRGQFLDVSPNGRLATAWGALKERE